MENSKQIKEIIQKASFKQNIDADRLYEEKINRQVLKMDGRPSSISELIKDGAKRQKQKMKKLQKRKIKKVSLSEMKLSKSIDYQSIIPLNKLWQQYCLQQLQEYSNVSSEDLQNNLQMKTQLMEKIFKLDIHASHVKVYSSKSKCQIGMQGFILQDLANSFKIVQEDNKVKTLGKNGLVLEMLIPFGQNQDESIKNFKFLLFGSQYVGRPSQRISKKGLSPVKLDV